METITGLELLQLTLIMGAPVYGVGLIVALIMLIRAKVRRFVVFTTILVTFVLALSMTVVIWSLSGYLEISEKIFMLFGFINTPALLAWIMIMPILTWLSIKFGKININKIGVENDK